jgi:REP element-mobilizing transposase RayT
MNIFDDIEIKERNLPHWHRNGAMYFITFNLADSLPSHIINELQERRELWLKKHNKPYSKEDLHEYYFLFSNRIEELLNSGHGTCLLHEYENSKIVADAINYFNNNRYILDEWVVMPNHIHVIVQPLSYSLTSITHSWKSYSAQVINKRMNQTGKLWMPESYDHIIRNEQSLEKIREYIKNNPEKAKVNIHHASFLNKNDL